MADNCEIGGDSNEAAAPGCPVLSTNTKTLLNKTPLTLTASYQTLETVTAPGKFVYCVIEFNTSDCTVKLTIDSKIIWEIDRIEDYLDVLSTSPHPSSPMGLSFDNANAKALVFSPVCPIDVETDWKIEAKTSGSNKSYETGLIMYTDET